MIKQIKMPSAGQTTDSAFLSKWCVQKGDQIKRGDVLLEAETDKASLPVECFSDGIILDILVPEGETVEAGMVLALLGDAQDAALYQQPPAELNASAPEKVNATAQTETETDEYIAISQKAGARKQSTQRAAEAYAPASPCRAMPNAKKLAREIGVDIAGLTKTGGELITRKEVLACEKPGAYDYTELELSRMRQTIGRRMMESVTTIPAFRVTVEADMTQVIAMKKAYQEKSIKISYNDILMKCVAVASEKYQLIRARFEEGECRIYAACNIGLAVSLDEGIIVPVAKGVEKMSVAEIAACSQALVEGARRGSLLADELGCGCLTVSNLGMYDVMQFDPIINPPESCIIGMGKIFEKVLLRQGQLSTCAMMNITGAFDHRLMDGAYAASFMRELKQLLEIPAMLYERET